MERGARKHEEAILVSRKAHATPERAFSSDLARQLADGSARLPLD
jgi:hypothetical protein